MSFILSWIAGWPAVMICGFQQYVQVEAEI